MVAVLGAMVLWSCSQDEEIEEQMEWSKKAVKKSLASDKPVMTEAYYFRPTFTFYQGGYPKKIQGTYNILLSVYTDTVNSSVYYEYEAKFRETPLNEGLYDETVEVTGSTTSGGFHDISFKIGAYYGRGERQFAFCNAIIPPWII